MKEVCPTTTNLYKSRSPSLAQARRPSSKRAKIRNPEGQPQATTKGTNQRAGTPAPASRVLPPEDPPRRPPGSATVTHQGTKPPPAPKDQCFHTTFPIKNDLKMLKL